MSWTMKFINKYYIMSKVNILELAMAQTSTNISTTKVRKSINDSLLNLLYTQKLKLTKQELIARISLERLEDSIDGELTAELFQSQDVQKEFLKINKTVKNGLETATCNAQNNAAFKFNPRFEEYNLEKLNNKYQITKKK